MKTLTFFIAFIVSMLVFQPALAQFTPVQEQTLEKNYAPNGGFENAKAGWVAYKDAAGVLPVDGTGGSPGVTITTSTSAPIAGKSSGILTKGASNLQGEGISYAFTVDKAVKGKPINIIGQYEILSGTYSGGTSTTDSDVEVYIYDVDSSTLIQPTGYKLDGAVAGVTYDILAKFQPVNLTSVNYRLILHVVTTSASAYSLKLDSIKVGLQNRSQGPPLTDPVAFTPVWNADNITNTGTTTGFYHREGAYLVVDFDASYGSGGTSSAVTTMTLPNGYVIDSAKTNVSSTQTYGSAQAFVSGVRYPATAAYGGTNKVFFIVPTAVGSAGYLDSSTIASGSGIAGQFKVPIVGWSSTVTMSDSADTRVIAAAYTKTSSQSITTATNTIVPFSTLVYDTTGSYNTSTGIYTAPIPGKYRFTGHIEFGTSATGHREFYVHRNNGDEWRLLYVGNLSGSIPTIGGGSATLDLNAGDQVDYRVYQDSGGSLNVSPDGVTYNHIEIERISGPSQVAASESVSVRYTCTSGQSIPTSSFTIINFATASYDSHSAVTTGASWKFTAPVSGKYAVKASIFLASASWTAGQPLAIDIYKNGSAVSQGPQNIAATLSAQYGTQINDNIQLKAGDYIDLRVFQGQGGSVALNSSGTYNYVSIERVGN